jgi:hypothetical protein
MLLRLHRAAQQLPRKLRAERFAFGDVDAQQRRDGQFTAVGQRQRLD